MSPTYRNEAEPGIGGHPSLSVVIATLQRPQSLAQTLASIRACDPAPAEIIVVDGDPDGSARAAVEVSNSTGAEPRTTYLLSATGLTHQRNLGATAAAGEVVVFLDDDVTVPADAFGALAEAYRDPSIVGATGRIIGDRSRIVNRESSLRRFLPGGGSQGSFTRYGYPHYVVDVGEPRDVEHMPGCFMSARRDLTLELGFDERLTGYALAEDEDFSCRLARRGRVRYLPGIIVEHRLEPHKGSSSRSLSRAVVVNRTYLFRKNFVRTPLARLQFAFLIVLMTVHRLVGGDFSGARGITEGAAEALRRGAPAGKGRPPTSGGIAGKVPVVFVSSHAREGGTERHLGWLIERMDNSWVSAVVSLEEGPLPELSRRLDHRTVVLTTGNRETDLLVSGWRLRRLLLRLQPGAVHASGVKAAAVAGLATIGTGIPVVWLKVDFSMDGWRSALIASRCAQIVGVSKAVLRPFGPRVRHKLRVVHNGIPEIPVDRARGRQQALARFGSEPAPEKLVTLVGRLDPDKGHEELLEAAPEILRHEPRAGFLIIGGSDHNSAYAAHLRRRVEQLGLHGSVRFLPHQDDVRDLISGCDALVHASVLTHGVTNTEGFPLIALEAMYAGTPVVAYDNGGIVELVGACGVIVPRGDRAALARSIVELLGDEGLRERLSDCGRRRVASEFLLTANVEALQDCYRAVRH